MGGLDDNPQILALCAGYGGLEMAVTPVIGGAAVAYAENDPYAAAVFAHHHHGVPNIGDIREADWLSVRDTYRPNVITAGFPCRNISNAGDRSGIDGQWSRVWKNVRDAIRVIRPGIVFLENVAAIRSRGLGVVLGDLVEVGYDTRWLCVRASDAVGACHPRDRWLGVAYPAVADPDLSGWIRGTGDVPEPARWNEPAHDGADTARVVDLLPTPKASDGPNGGPNQRDSAGNFYLPGVAVRLDRDWTATNGKDYGPAIRRWERVLGRSAPNPTEPGTRGNRRLSPVFEEWMMGLPEGWVTAVPEIPRKEKMRMLGNGLVPQQGEWGFRALLGMNIDEPEKDDMAEKTDKPRGGCTGCAFEYQLGTARSGEYKGQLVIRKHNSRTGPGLCAGASKPPRIDLGEATGDEQAFADPAPVTEDNRGPYVTAAYDSVGSCGHEIMSGEEIRADGEGGWLCGLCSDEGPKPDRPQHTFDNGRGGIYVHEGLAQSCMQDECVELKAGRQSGELKNVESDLPHDRRPETVTHIPNGHDFTDSSGTTWRHGGTFDDCTTLDCVQFRNRVNPPAVSTPIAHQRDAGLFAELRNCPEHGTPTVVEKLADAARDAFPEPTTVLGVMTPSQRAEALGIAQTVTAQFADPAPMPAELPPVSGQPEPDRDRWGRYKILGQSHTRATSFAKLGSSTYALGEWNERMLILGLTKRQDLLAMAHGLDVKRDKDTLNSIADQAQETAGNKVAANIGTAYHSFTERIDAGLMTLEQVPEQWRGRCRQYVDALTVHGLRTRQEWIERTTAVRADQVSAPVPVAGTLDRIFELPNGELVIGDLKTSSNIDYSWSEIAVQLALYAHGVNTHGLFDWNTKTWQGFDATAQHSATVRTDYAIVVHLPAQGDGCTLYRVDLERGWKFAQVSGMVQARQKAKDIAGVMVPLPQPAPAPVQPEPIPQVLPPRPEYVNALGIVSLADDPATLGTLYDYAVQSGQFTEDELTGIKDACAVRWAELNIPY